MYRPCDKSIAAVEPYEYFGHAPHRFPWGERIDTWLRDDAVTSVRINAKLPKINVMASNADPGLLRGPDRHAGRRCSFGNLKSTA